MQINLLYQQLLLMCTSGMHTQSPQVEVLLGTLLPLNPVAMIDIETVHHAFLESIKCTVPSASNIFKSAEQQCNIDQHSFAPLVDR